MERDAQEPLLGARSDFAREVEEWGGEQRITPDHPHQSPLLHHEQAQRIAGGRRHEHGARERARDGQQRRQLELQPGLQEVSTSERCQAQQSEYSHASTPRTTSTPSRRSLPSSRASIRAVTPTTPSVCTCSSTSASRCNPARSLPSPTGTRICATGRSAWAEDRSACRSAATPAADTVEVSTACG